MERLARPPRYQVKTEERQKPVNVKERIVRRGSIRTWPCSTRTLPSSLLPHLFAGRIPVVHYAENLGGEGQEQLFEEFAIFYITMSVTWSVEQVVFQANDRCDQEN